MKMKTYVNFAGRCAEAFRFYEQHLGAHVGMMMTHGQAPDQSKVSPEMKDAVLHARLSVAGTELMGADIPHALELLEFQAQDGSERPVGDTDPKSGTR